MTLTFVVVSGIIEPCLKWRFFMNCLRVVKEISEDRLLVYCTSCKSYFAMDRYEFNRNLNGGDIRSCKFCCRTNFGDYAPYYHQRYGTLRVLAKLWAEYSCYFVCKCDCGTYLIVESSYLTSGYAFSCGCIKRRRLVPEFKGKSEYVLTSEDMENMDKLVCSLPRTLKPKTKVYKLADGETKQEMTLKSLVAQYRFDDIDFESVVEPYPTKVDETEDNATSDEVQEEQSAGIDASNAVDMQSLDGEGAQVGIEEEPELPWDVLKKQTVKEVKPVVTEEESKCEKVVEEPKEISSDGTFDNVTFSISVTTNSVSKKKRIEIRGNFIDVDKVITEAGFVTSKECDISKVAVFMNYSESDLDKMLSLHYTGEGDYFVKLNENSIISDVCMLSGNCLVVFSSRQSDGYLRLIGGLLC